jgi:hypothetical protein
MYSLEEPQTKLMEITVHRTVRTFIEVLKEELEVLEIDFDRLTASLFTLHFYVICDLQRNVDIIICLPPC